MSEPMNAEERARLREVAEFAPVTETTFGAKTVLALLDEVDRLTEALEAALSDDRHAPAGVIADQLAKWKRTAERAEADLADMTAEQARSQAHVAQAERELADEKRRRMGVEELHWAGSEGNCVTCLREPWPCPTSALLSDTAREGL